MLTTILLPFILLPLSLAKDWAVDVGESGLVFNPTSVTAAKGDNVIFTFYPMNHSVAQSSFDKPCAPIDNAIFSGFVPVASGKGSKTFSITIQDDKPIWLYCSQGEHCLGGMAMGINPSKTNTVDAYIAASRKASTNVSPDKVSNGTTSGGSSSSSGSSSATGSSSAGSSSATGKSTGTSTGTATSTSSTAKPSNAAGSLTAGVGMGVMGLLGVLAGGMI